VISERGVTTSRDGVVVLAIESSCDETAAAVVEDGRRVLANVVASQVALHAPSGGIVPEVAARAHLRWIVPVVERARDQAGAAWSRIAAVAVTEGPGLAGSLLVGINFAKALAVARGWPLVPVNHLEGHIHAAWLTDEPDDRTPEFPLVALVVSGGHTILVEMEGPLDYELLGRTVDDAAGEAFDKVARLLGLAYPGGPAIMAAAQEAADRRVVLPRAWLRGSYDFSFSGLKTAVRRMVEEQDTGTLSRSLVAEIAWAFQESVVDVLVTKTIRAAEERGARSVILGGGVAANLVLRERLAAAAAERGLPLHVPAPEFCTDNAAMIGAAGHARFRAGRTGGLDLDARPSLALAG
jgi:N6-L-threonylcarbamoyladenine synthase